MAAPTLCRVQTSLAEWLNTAATCVIAVGGAGAFVYAARTYGAQSRQLAVAKADSARLRTPVLRGEIGVVGGQGGDRKYRLDVWLLTSEPLARLRVRLEEARGNDCIIGFTPGQTGVAQHPDQDTLPPGWRNDVLRHEAGWAELAPGAAATWQLAQRNGVREGADGRERIRLSAECEPAGGGQSWRVHVPVTMTVDAERALAPRARIRTLDS